MIVGGVYFFNTNQAIGHNTRDKYHIYLGETNDHRADEPHAFLFINKGDYGGCFPLLVSDCGCLQYDSYVGCNGLVFYSDNQLTSFNPEHKLTLDGPLLVSLRNHLVDAAGMTGWEIRVACNALAVFV